MNNNMPKKGHTCCVLGCTVNSKKTVLADGRRPRFFCFPHEKKRPHLRRAWLALTRRTEASTNTRVCEFHFVDSKPSAVNPHPILNMGMEATKMQKRAIELRQQKELRRMIMQQQMAGQLLMAGQQGELEGLQMVGQEGGPVMVGLPSPGQMDADDMLQEEGTYPYIPVIEHPYADHVKTEAEGENGLPSQVGYQNPLPLVVPHRINAQEYHKINSQMSEMEEEMQMINGEAAEGSPPTQTDIEGNYEVDNVAKNPTESPPAQSQQEQRPAEDTLPEDCSKIVPLNAPENTSPSSSGVCPLSSEVVPLAITSAARDEDTDTNPTAATTGKDPEKAQGAMNLAIEENGHANFISQGIRSTQEGNPPLPMVGNRNGVPSIMGNHSNLSLMLNQKSLLAKQNGLPSVAGKSTPLKVPSWQLRINGTTASTSPSGAPPAKRARKRKSTPKMKTAYGTTVSIPTMMDNVPTQPPKSLNQSNMLMSMQTVETLKSDILENLRAEFLTELHQESESNKQLQVEMETIRLQTRQELQQMRVELHALWGENQRLRAQVESLLQEKENGTFDN